MTSSGLDPDRSGAPAVLLLDVGQGDASLILLPDAPRRAVVVDCNDAHVVLRHLADFAVERLEAVIFTHLDKDHIGGGLRLLQEWKDRTAAVYIDSDGRTLRDDTDVNERAKELFDAVIEMRNRDGLPGPELMPPVRDPRAIAEGDRWRVRIVAPSHGATLAEHRGGRTRTANEHSAIVRVERDVGDQRVAVLIGGDAPLVVWSDLPARDRSANVFRAPHHGGALDDGGVPAGWSAATLYDEVGAADVVLSVGTNNDHEHPSSIWREPLQGRDGCYVRCTQVTRACHATLDEDIASLRERVLSERGRAEPAWRHLTLKRGDIKQRRAFREVPCAGTVAVGLRSDGEVTIWPRADAHTAIVKGWSRPWCRPDLHEERVEETDVAIDSALDALFED